MQIDFIADDQPLSEACSQKDVQINVTISSFSLELEFMDWFEVAASTIEEDSGIGSF